MAEERITRADVHRLAEQVMGSKRDARTWLTTPAMALDQRRPVDLMVSDEGLRTVHTLLTQLEYGVYV
jgi:putative toxin-antitoxin system antitoxin component (TIGR02293 family)